MKNVLSRVSVGTIAAVLGAFCMLQIALGATTVGNNISTDGTLSVTGLSTFNGDFAGSTNVNGTFNGTENFALTSNLVGAVDPLSIVVTPGSSANTATNGIFIQQANSAFTNGLDTGLTVRNSDDIAIPQGILIESTSTGGFTDAIQILATSGTIFDGIQIGTGTQTITNAISMASTGITTDIILQNGETINNDNTSGQVVLTGAGGTNNESLIVDLDSSLASGPTLSAGGSHVLVNDSLAIGIAPIESEAISDAAFVQNTNDVYVDGRLGVDGITVFEGDIVFSAATPTITVNNSQSLTIADGTGNVLILQAAGFAPYIGGVQGQRICHSAADNPAAGTLAIVGDCSGGGTDFAEMYGTVGPVEAGDLVMPSGAASEFKMLGNTSSKAFVRRSTGKAYEAGILGVVSTEPFSEVLGTDIFEKKEKPFPVALIGRVPVKVTNENGPISIGDYLTSSSTPGYAMRATASGRIIGVALSSSARSRDKIIVFVNPFWWNSSSGNLFEKFKKLPFGSQVVSFTQANELFIPMSSYAVLSCSGNVTVTLDEGFAVAGQLLMITIKNTLPGAGSCSFPDTAGLQKGPRNALGNFDSVSFMYDGNQWVTLSYSNN